MSKVVYRHSLHDAVEWGERDEWRESFKLNCDCARAIEKAIRENFDGMNLAPGCQTPIITEYGNDRVKWVLANTLREKNTDGRFSERNRKWLAGKMIPQDDHNWQFVADSHPAVLDGFISGVRKSWESLCLYDVSHCIPENGEELDYEGRVLIFDAENLNDEHLNPESQLFLAKCGFGCKPDSRGRKIFGQFLSDGEKCHITREDVVGIIRNECLPDWAKVKLDTGEGNNEGMVIS